MESQTPRTHIKIQDRAGSGLDGVAHEASPVALPPANSATLAGASIFSGQCTCRMLVEAGGRFFDRRRRHIPAGSYIPQVTTCSPF